MKWVFSIPLFISLLMHLASNSTVNMGKVYEKEKEG